MIANRNASRSSVINWGPRIGRVGIQSHDEIFEALKQIVSDIIADRLLATRWQEIATTLRPAFVSTAVTAVGALALQQVLSPAIRLSGIALAGAALYGLILWLTERATVQQAFTLIRQPGRTALS